jgi:diaminohydroxyphosphoribosylaminopyrimidine deaminase / 5-amino-6-(5-phosphoribosylamino)uracil reductase
MTESRNRRVTLKLATSLDGRIALANGASRWITGSESREAVHQLRAAHDVVLTGIGTILADDPQLTVRLPDYDGPQPGRVILDTRLRISPDARVFANSGPTMIFCGPDVPTHSKTAIESRGASVEPISRYDGPSVSFKSVLERVRALDGQSVMIEAGSKIAASALKHGLVDIIEWFRAPIVLGGDGFPVIAALGLERLDEAPIFSRVSVSECGDDLHERYERKRD